MSLLYSIVNPETSKLLFCNSPAQFRFSWLSKFVCQTKPESKPEVEIKPEVAPNVTLGYEEYVKLNYVKTGKAVPPRGSTNPNNIGAFASYPHLNTACPMTPKSRLWCPVESKTWHPRKSIIKMEKAQFYFPFSTKFSIFG